MTRMLRWLVVVLVVGPAAAALAQSADGAQASPPTPERRSPSRQDIALQLQNPLPNLMSLRSINDVDMGLGEGDGESQTRVRMVVFLPMRLTSRWNLVSQTVVFVHSNPPPGPDEDRVNGLGDTLQKVLLSPAHVGVLAWGVGPALELPTATRTALGTGQVSMGPAVSLVHQDPNWTLALRAWQLWSVQGVRGARAVERTHLQPNVAFTFDSGVTLGLGTEAVIDWRAPEGVERLALPLHLTIGQVTDVASQKVNLELGGRYHLVAPDAGPEWGVRLSVAMTFPIQRNE